MGLTSEQRKTKEIAIAILKAQGKSYDLALDEFHQAIILNNQELILTSLQIQAGKKERQGGTVYAQPNTITDQKFSE
ncbi:hypothetical protein IGI96_002898 [Enterococcus sp. DIV0421]|uniref:hypothetical protein n=1 Tax=Enterococcus sp. DIV0421 TaxID=2774688 RepID=UPI003F1EAFA0